MGDTAVRLILRLGIGVAVPAPAPLVEALRSATVETGSGSDPTGFELTFAVGQRSPLNDLFALVRDESIPDVRVAIGLVVRGTATFLVDGVMTHQEIVQRDGTSTLIVKGRDLTAVMDREQRSETYRTGEAMRARTILLRYARFGIVPVVVEPGASGVLGAVGAAAGGVAAALGGLFGGGQNATGVGGPGGGDTHATQRATDYAYLVEMAAAVGWIFAIEPTGVAVSVGYWGPEIRAGVPQRTITGELDPLNRSVTTLSFSYDKEQRQAAEVAVDGRTEAFDGIAWSAPLAKIVPAPAKTETLPGTDTLSPDRARILGRAFAAAHADTLKGTGSLDVARYGDVLVPRRLVGVRGAGDSNNGLHFVRKVTTTIRRGEVLQSFELAREGLQSTVPKLGVTDPWT